MQAAKLIYEEHTFAVILHGNAAGSLLLFRLPVLEKCSFQINYTLAKASWKPSKRDAMEVF